MGLEGQKAIVTGASRGMGKYFAAALAKAGVRVALFARASEALEKAQADIGGNALAVPCDISNPQAVREAFAIVEKEFGALDILINNAGASVLGRTYESSDEAIALQIGVNFAGPIYMCREATPLLRRSKLGQIINVSSESVKGPYPMLGIYAASKAALEFYTRQLRKELRQEGIRVTTLRSGFVRGSEMMSNWADPNITKTFVEECMQHGSLIESGSQGAPPEAMAEALVQLLTMNAALNADILELRPLAP